MCFVPEGASLPPSDNTKITTSGRQIKYFSARRWNVDRCFKTMCLYGLQRIHVVLTKLQRRPRARVPWDVGGLEHLSDLCRVEDPYLSWQFLRHGIKRGRITDAHYIYLRRSRSSNTVLGTYPTSFVGPPLSYVTHTLPCPYTPSNPRLNPHPMQPLARPVPRRLRPTHQILQMRQSMESENSPFRVPMTRISSRLPVGSTESPPELSTGGANKVVVVAPRVRSCAVNTGACS